ncbi:DMT family transporter [Luteipulveratus halotolerans]|uniref:EamA domain-containing protein n=1 Tax=Luteipulveratus halotolerans TaxID=1631356 RepID=A0A0L6CHF3_9MICO|nr:DMT family transporter [Luteipulveratus halotolerans]KNX37015.1 hypothetical protein VV01_07415 [Luteipulveratus halotolerans]
MITLLALASSAVWGTSDFAGGLLSRRIAAVRVVAFSQIGGLAVITAVLGLSLTLGDRPDGLGWLAPGLASGMVGALGLTAFYAALASGTMGIVSPIAALGAAVPVVLGVLGGDRLGGLVLIGMALAITGAALASGPELTGSAPRRPVALAVVAAVSFGLSLYLLDRASAYDVVAGLWAMRVGSVALLLLVLGALMRRGGLREGRASRADLPALLLLGTGDLVANALFGVATTRGYVSVASVLGSLYPVATLLWARYLLGERMRPVQAVGVGLAVVGVVLTAS